MGSALSAGTRLGRYEIRSQLGAGGMGEVYRAHDEKLNRDVAIKVLPSAFSRDAERLRRFEQEAQAASALNHPNILAVYDFGEHEGAPYVISELLEGETLREWLNNGAANQRQTIEYAIQIVQGLAAAHEKGIVHRDLKPENLFITKDERLKILDFGLAKLVESVDQETVHTDMPTRRINTEPGAILGTVGYMSPEQAEGRRVDHRTDIFSFGAVLYEMLAGKGAFDRDTVIETLHAILKEEPRGLGDSNASVHPALEKIVRRCLEKKPERRFQSAGDLCFAIEALTTSSSFRPGSFVATAATDSQIPTPKKWLFHDVRLAWIMATVLLVLTLSLAWAYFTRRPAEARAMKLSVLPPEKTSFGHAIVSPDGRLLAFTGATGGKLQLWVRALDATEARLLAGTEGAVFPFWSPDSHHLGFFAGGKLKKIDVSGSLPATLCDVIGVGIGGSWNRDGVIIFASLDAGLSRVSANGGEVTSVMKPGLKRQESSYGYPYFLPDGRHFLFGSFTGQKETRGIYYGSLDGGINQRLLGDDSNAAYAASGTDSGYLLFAREEELMAQAFEPEAGQLTGEPFRVAGQVGMVLGVAVNSRLRNFSVSENGVLVFDPLPNRQHNQVSWLDRSGRTTGSLSGEEVDNAQSVRLAPDNKRFALVRPDLQLRSVSNLWLSDMTIQNATRFTFDPGVDLSPIWSPDGIRIVWGSNREGLFQLYEKSASGSGQDTLFFKSDYSKYPTDWSRDGRFIIYRRTDPKTKYDVWVLPVGSIVGDQKPFPFLQTQANEVAAMFSPDGRWVAYGSDESGQYEIYVQSFPTGGGKRQVSKGGGLEPQWRGDGKELFYHAPDGKLMAVAVMGGASFDAGQPVALFEFRPPNSIAWNNSYSVTSDGQRFLLTTVVPEAPAPLTVVVNWTADLKR